MCKKSTIQIGEHNFRLLKILEKGKTITLVLAYDKEVEDIVKKHFNKKRCTKALLKRFVKEALQGAVDETNT